MPSAEKSTRLNGAIRAFEQGKAAFVTFAHLDLQSTLALRNKTEYDALVYEMEHSPYDIRGFADNLQYLLDRKHIATTGNLAPAVTPFARIPPNGSEMNQWMAKQVLDMGAYGVLWPHVSSVAEARNAVTACRFPRPKGAPLYEPAGLRGDGPGRAVNYWGISLEDYYERADVWPLNPQGEILVGIMCEEVLAIKNLPAMLKEVPGIGYVVIGRADLSQDLGVSRRHTHPTMLAAMDEILAICQAHNVPCGLPGVSTDEVEGLLKKGYRWLMTSPTPSYANLELGRKLNGR